MCTFIQWESAQSYNVLTEDLSCSGVTQVRTITEWVFSPLSSLFHRNQQSFVEIENVPPKATSVCFANVTCLRYSCENGCSFDNLSSAVSAAEHPTVRLRNWSKNAGIGTQMSNEISQHLTHNIHCPPADVAHLGARARAVCSRVFHCLVVLQGRSCKTRTDELAPRPLGGKASSSEKPVLITGHPQIRIWVVCLRLEVDWGVSGFGLQKTKETVWISCPEQRRMRGLKARLKPQRFLRQMKWSTDLCSCASLRPGWDHCQKWLCAQVRVCHLREAWCRHKTRTNSSLLIQCWKVISGGCLWGRVVLKVTLSCDFSIKFEL